MEEILASQIYLDYLQSEHIHRFIEIYPRNVHFCRNIHPILYILCPSTFSSGNSSIPNQSLLIENQSLFFYIVKSGSQVVNRRKYDFIAC